MAKTSRVAFGSESNVDTALTEGKIDACDILLLDEKKIGWIDKNGQKVILEDKQQVSICTTLPEVGKGKPDVLYVVVDASNAEAVTASGYIYNGDTPIRIFTSTGGGIDEATVDSKIEEAMTIVEF